MKFEMDDIFEIKNDLDGTPVTHHIIMRLTKKIRGTSWFEVIKIEKMNHLNEKIGQTVAYPNYALFGKLSERWVTTKRITKKDHPEYYL